LKNDAYQFEPMIEDAEKNIGKRINKLTNMVRHNYFQNSLFAGFGCGGRKRGEN